MTVELAEVAAGLPLAASFALAGGITTLREGRRRTALNEAMHELRRPLQALSLALPTESAGEEAVDSSLRLAVAALERLDREINGDTLEQEVVGVPVGFLLEAAVQRWSRRAGVEGRELHLRGVSDEQWVTGSQTELAQALDNLISNAFEHGAGKVGLEGRREGSWISISVRDAGPKRPRPCRSFHRPWGASRSRHGHGLRVVARVAGTHGGSFRLRQTEQGTEARMRLPLDSTEGER
ncbi:MAG: sensor histidine kinase [Solirubrobacterales bacterium]